MTILEAIKTVLTDHSDGLTVAEIYSEIIKMNLYTFKARNPVAVVNGELRRRCQGLDFPTAHPVKFFEIKGTSGKKPKFGLIDDSLPNTNKEPIPIHYVSSELLPEEKVGLALEAYYSSIKQQLMERILKNSPSFFEHLVVDLLLKMGYGYGDDSGAVTGRSHDGGIDGIISEDSLGLSKIYLQAKRYMPGNNVGVEELQAFIGAMQNVNKGVFFTTSTYTKEAVRFISGQQQKSIKLVDGALLTDLLIKYHVGIMPVQTFSLFRIDSDYYLDS